MKTITVQVWSRIDKLPQNEWMDFVHDMNDLVNSYSNDVSFSNTFPENSVQQNYCWVFELDETKKDEIVGKIKDLKTAYSQDFVAFTTGDTEML